MGETSKLTRIYNTIQLSRAQCEMEGLKKTSKRYKELAAMVTAYEAAVSGAFVNQVPKSIEELRYNIVAYRLFKKIPQVKLASVVSIQNKRLVELDREDYASATFMELIAIFTALEFLSREEEPAVDLHV